MIFLLSPAKSLIEGPALAEHAATQPDLLPQTEVLLETVRGLSSGDLQSLMHISEALGDLNHERFQTLATPFDRDNARQAALLFDGDVYKGLDAHSLSADDLTWSQERIGILSGLYGLLRPLDLVQPYRLEMGTRLATDRGANLYAFWGSHITDALRARLDGNGWNTVINLASKEYFSSIKQKDLGATWITPAFKDRKDGKSRVISFYAKRARGAMVRWAIEQRVTEPEQLKACDVMGYTFDAEASTAKNWVFSREQPPPAKR
jgi:cytoplasmic iron level regulating protein YaaA (DUF328/UPF0246 family)